MILALIVLALCLLASVAENYFIVLNLTKLHQKEKENLHDSLRSKSLEEFKYWAKTFPVELEHNEKVLEKDRGKKEPTAEEKMLKEKAKGF
jgi:putative exporter of polyketide antibiotics